MKSKKGECVITGNGYTFDSRTQRIKKNNRRRNKFVCLTLVCFVMIGIFVFLNKGENIQLAYTDLSNNEMLEEKVNKDLPQEELIYETTESKDLDDDSYTVVKSIKDNQVKMTVSSVQNRTSGQGGAIDITEPVDPSRVEYTLKSSTFELSEKDYEALLRIVEAEATDEDLIGKILIANVVFNRMKFNGFPDSAYEVIHEQINGHAQFSPISDGRYYSVKITDSTREAVERAVNGEDYSKGALFFVARSMADQGAVSWFDRDLNRLFKHGVHEFFAYK